MHATEDTLTWQDFMSHQRNSSKSVWKAQKVCQVCVWPWIQSPVPPKKKKNKSQIVSSVSKGMEQQSLSQN